MSEAAALVALAPAVAVLAGRPVCVLGSAPLVEDTALEAGEAVITVNGSLSSAPEIVPDVHVMNARSRPLRTWHAGRRALHTAMVAQAARRRVGVLVLLLVDAGAEEPWLARLRDQGTTWDRVAVVPKGAKDVLGFEVGALDKKQRADHGAISAGIAAACLALYAGAPRVRLEGFSFDAGYAYLGPGQCPASARGHVDADRAAVEALAARYPGRLVGDLCTRRAQRLYRVIAPAKPAVLRPA